VREPLRPRDLDTAERADVAEVDARPRHVGHVDVRQAVALDRREEDVLGERVDRDVGGLAGVEHAGGPGRAQERALLADEEAFEQRVAVGGHGHGSSRGRSRTSAAHERRPARDAAGEIDADARAGLEKTAVRGRETDVVALLGAHDGRAA